MTEAYTQPDPTTFDWYESALKGVRLDCNPNEPQTGYYRDQRKNLQTNEITIRPVAFYYFKGKMFCRVSGAHIEPEKALVLWPFVSKRPIAYDLYKSVIAGNPWPDEVSAEAKAIAASVRPSLPNTAPVEIADTAAPAEREIQRTDNNPPEQLPHIAAAEIIDNAIKAAQAQFSEVTSDAQAELALGSKNRLADLRLAADKAGKAEYEPHFAKYKEAYNRWHPMVDRSSVQEKALERAVKVWREKERQRLAAEAAKAAALQAEEDERNARAADRAIAAGEPEPAPEVTQPQPSAPAAAPLVPTYGRRTIKEELKTFAVVDDWALVAKHFVNNLQLQELLMKLAQAEVNAGRTPPGTHTREGLV